MVVDSSHFFPKDLNPQLATILRDYCQSLGFSLSHSSYFDSKPDILHQVLVTERTLSLSLDTFQAELVAKGVDKPNTGGKLQELQPSSEIRNEELRPGALGRC